MTSLITLNVYNPRPLANEVYILDNLTKTQILKALEEAVSAEFCWLGTAESIAKIDQVNPDILTTPREWLEERGHEWNKSDRRKFEMRVSKLFKEKYGEQPRSAFRQGSSTAKWKKSVNVYDPEKDRDIFKGAYDYVKSTQDLAAPAVEAKV